MSEFTLSSDMSLPIPNVGVAPGPNYASDVNGCLTIIDSHDHSFGKGVLITPNGLNINIDLPINNNNLTLIRSTRFFPQLAPLSNVDDLGCLYEAGVDLWYNDGIGNQIRITQSGGVAGSPGSISGLVSPASASYNPGSSTFVWQSNTNTAANMDAGSLIIRDVTASSNGVTLSAPISLGADYTITLPTGLPGSASFLGIDSSGNLSATIPLIAGITSSNIAAATILGSNIATHTVTLQNQVAPNTFTSGSSGGFFLAVGNTAHTQVTNFSVAITTTGNPVSLTFQYDGLGAPSNLAVQGHFAYIYNDAGASNLVNLYQFVSSGSFPPGCLNFTDNSVLGVPGTYTYSLYLGAQNGSVSAAVQNMTMTVREL